MAARITAGQGGPSRLRLCPRRSACRRPSRRRCPASGSRRASPTRSAKRLTLVVAPAGSGKTTLLARFAATSGAAVGWYRAESWDADEASFVRHLEAVARGGRPVDLTGGWANVEDAARDLEAAAGSRPGPVLLVIDDFYYLEDTAAEAALRAPRRLRARRG